MSKKLIAIIAGVVVVGALIALSVVKSAKGKVESDRKSVV